MVKNDDNKNTHEKRASSSPFSAPFLKCWEPTLAPFTFEGEGVTADEAVANVGAESDAETNKPPAEGTEHGVTGVLDEDVFGVLD